MSMWMRCPWLLAGLVVAPLALPAQLREADTLRWQANLRADGTWSTGNVRRFVSLFGGEVLYLPARWGVKSANTYQYGTFAGRVSENDFASRNFWYWQPRQRVYPFAMAWWERSHRQQVDVRWQAGGGATWRILAGKRNGLRLSLSNTYERSTFRRSDFTDSRYRGNSTWDTWRATARLAGTHQLTSGGLLLTHESWFQQSLRDRGNYRTYAQANLSVPVSTHLRLSASVMHTYESVHLNRIRPDDTLVLFGLRWGTVPAPQQTH